MKGIYKNVSKLTQLYVTIPMSNATAEKSFSCLRQLKNYLRNRLTQEHLNHRMFLHIHKDLIDQLDFASVHQEFITINNCRIIIIIFFFGEMCKYLHLTWLSYWKQVVLLVHILL